MLSLVSVLGNQRAHQWVYLVSVCRPLRSPPCPDGGSTCGVVFPTGCDKIFGIQLLEDGLDGFQTGR
jgi:hypothetical protein